MKNKQKEAIELLTDMVAIPSISKNEDKSADLLESFFNKKGIPATRIKNNILVKNRFFSQDKLTILLNSHHDTVKPNNGYTKDPFLPEVREGKIFGLGTNDAGGSLVCLILTFLDFYHHKDLPYNLLLVASAEEEISGPDGIECVLDERKDIDFKFGIVGEPTEMKAAVAEKGLMVLDCYMKGKSGHAARDMGRNAIYESLSDIEWFRTYKFPRESEYLGKVRMTVTRFESGTQHNVIPDRAHFVVDVRNTDAYSNDELLEIIRKNVKSEVIPRSTRLSPSFLSANTELYEVIQKLNIPTFGSPTLSDQALIPFTTCKIGPGKSERSHTADEFILISEIEEGLQGYHKLFTNLMAHI